MISSWVSNETGLGTSRLFGILNFCSVDLPQKEIKFRNVMFSGFIISPRM